ncbi:MAG: Mor transcription activator family protein [Clostridium fessum]
MFSLLFDKLTEMENTRKISTLLSNEISRKKRYIKKRRKIQLQKVEKARPQDLVGIYGDLAEIIGVDNAIIIYKYFKGQQVSFPTRLYSKDFIVSQAISDESQTIKKLATQYGYSERRLRQIIQEKK